MVEDTTDCLMRWVHQAKNPIVTCQFNCPAGTDSHKIQMHSINLNHYKAPRSINTVFVAGKMNYICSIVRVDEVLKQRLMQLWNSWWHLVIEPAIEPSCTVEIMVTQTAYSITLDPWVIDNGSYVQSNAKEMKKFSSNNGSAAPCIAKNKQTKKQKQKTRENILHTYSIYTR